MRKKCGVCSGNDLRLDSNLWFRRATGFLYPWYFKHTTLKCLVIFFLLLYILFFLNAVANYSSVSKWLDKELLDITTGGTGIGGSDVLSGPEKSNLDLTCISPGCGIVPTWIWNGDEVAGEMLQQVVVRLLRVVTATVLWVTCLTLSCSWAL